LLKSPAIVAELSANLFLNLSLSMHMLIKEWKVLGFLQAFEESSDWGLLSWLCDDSDLHASMFR